MGWDASHYSEIGTLLIFNIHIFILEMRDKENIFLWDLTNIIFLVALYDLKEANNSPSFFIFKCMLHKTLAHLHSKWVQ